MGDSWKRPSRVLTVVAVAVLLSLGLIEGALRLTLKQSDLYRGLAAYPDLNRRHYELQFIEQRGAADSPIGEYDPDLGWDMHIATGRVRMGGAPDPGASRRIVAVGDSFTYGAEVGDNQTFSRYLEGDVCSAKVLNMGVGGYGIDQAVLKYVRYGTPYRPDVILFGIHPPNYERASVPFFSASKPVFRRSTDGPMRLANHPVPPPASEAERIRRETMGGVYTWALARAGFLYVGGRIAGNAGFFEETDRIVEHVLSLLMKEAEATGARVLIVHIPLGQAFLKEPRWHRAMSDRLLAIYRKLGLRYLDLGETWRGRMAPEDVVRNFYVPRAGNAGHLSEAGNRATAAAIADVLKEWGFQAAEACPK